jgi:hypothetical protein
MVQCTCTKQQVSEPWAALLLSGAKPVETRSYPLPAALLNRKLAVIQSSNSTAPTAAASAAAAAVPATSSVTDTVAAGAAGLSRTGTVTFTSCKRYTSEAEWAADEARHLVKSDSPFGWRAVAQRAAAATGSKTCNSSNSSSGDSSSAEIWAWTVGKRKTHKKARPVPHMQRVFRSLFALHYDSADATDDAAEDVVPVAATVANSTATKGPNGASASATKQQQVKHSNGAKRSRDSTLCNGYSNGSNGTHKKSKRK